MDTIGATSIETYGRIINKLQKLAELKGKHVHTIAHYSKEGFNNEHAENVSRGFENVVLIVLPHGYELMGVK